jgi:hypothetical protein
MQHSFKIGFVGTGGVGKTSVADLLRVDPTVPEQFIPSIVRGVFSELGVTTEAQQLSMSEAKKWELQRTLFHRKCQQDWEHAHGIFDRTPVDHFAYGLYRCGGYITRTQLRFLKSLVLKYSKQYDVIFYFPLYDWCTDEVNDDGFRENRFAYRYAAQQLMVATMFELGITFIKVGDVSPEQRVADIKHVLKRMRTDPCYKLARHRYPNSTPDVIA